MKTAETLMNEGKEYFGAGVITAPHTLYGDLFGSAAAPAANESSSETFSDSELKRLIEKGNYAQIIHDAAMGLRVAGLVVSSDPPSKMVSRVNAVKIQQEAEKARQKQQAEQERIKKLAEEVKRKKQIEASREEGEGGLSELDILFTGGISLEQLLLSARVPASKPARQEYAVESVSFGQGNFVPSICSYRRKNIHPPDLRL